MGPAWLSGDCHGLESESWDQYLAGEPQVSQRELVCPQGPTMGSRHAGAQPSVTVLTLLSASVPCSRTPLSSLPPLSSGRETSPSQSQEDLASAGL